MTGYHEYLELDQLLDLQRPRTEHAATELAFIVVHQVAELWFKLIIDDIESAIQAFGNNDVDAVLRRLSRVHEVEQLLVDQFVVIDHLPPGGFGALRPALGTASAAESRQFAVIERLSCPRPRRRAPATGPARDLWTALCLHVTAQGYDMPTEDTDDARRRRQCVLHSLYRQSGRLSAVCEALLDHDHAFSVWRRRHVLAVERQIGRLPGTGGSTGLDYLERRCDRRFYPDLWSIRPDLVGS